MGDFKSTERHRVPPSAKSQPFQNITLKPQTIFLISLPYPKASGQSLTSSLSYIPTCTLLHDSNSCFLLFYCLVSCGTVSIQTLAFTPPPQLEDDRRGPLSPVSKALFSSSSVAQVPLCPVFPCLLCPDLVSLWNL